MILSKLTYTLFDKPPLNDGNITVVNGLPYLEGVGYLHSKEAQDFIGLSEREFGILRFVVLNCIIYGQPFVSPDLNQFQASTKWWILEDGFFTLSSAINVALGRQLSIKRLCSVVRKVSYSDHWGIMIWGLGILGTAEVDSFLLCYLSKSELKALKSWLNRAVSTGVTLDGVLTTDYIDSQLLSKGYAVDELHYSQPYSLFYRFSIICLLFALPFIIINGYFPLADVSWILFPIRSWCSTFFISFAICLHGRIATIHLETLYSLVKFIDTGLRRLLPYLYRTIVSDILVGELVVGLLIWFGLSAISGLISWGGLYGVICVYGLIRSAVYTGSILARLIFERIYCKTTLEVGLEVFGPSSAEALYKQPVN